MMKIPCIKEKGLGIFTATADERLLLGQKVFLNTHYPASFRRYRGESLKETWSENKVLELLNNYDHKVNGNRVFVLFGAAGSGKSESIRWLESQLSNDEIKKSIIRISRTELDPLKILQKLLSLNGQCVSEDAIIKWEVLKNKPVTLANSIVWNSLSLLLDTDEDIIPISYKLRPLIESNLRKSFSDLNRAQKLKEKVVELITVEELEEIVKNSAIPININYEQLRKHLVEKFESEVLGGYSFINTLREVGKEIYLQTGNRPIILIDDLVQSMNIYSSDLLDFFITFEEGNWDIVIGLTPASFETTKRGKELLTRINYLDTFDDRLYKLWLTDEYGNESYTIDLENASDYIRNYLIEYKKANGFICDKSCNNYSKCISAQWGEEKNLNLTPLNMHLANRIFENLFKSKGQARHYVITVKEYLNSIINGETLEFLSTRIIRECSVDIEDNDKKIFIESFMPVDSSGVLEVPGEFLRLCGFRRAGTVRTKLVNLRGVLKNNIVDNHVNNYIEHPEVSILRDWLEGKQVNKELFKNFRVSSSTFLREFSEKLDLIRQYTSKNYGNIRKEKTIEGCKLPISIQDVDYFEGINVEKSLGHSVFKFMQIKDTTGSTQAELINELLYEPKVSEMILQTNKIGAKLVEEFENEISISCSELSFLLYIFAYLRVEIKDIPLIIKKQYKKLSLQEFPDKWNEDLEDFSENELNFIQDFFNDWFQLRENLYDGFELKRLICSYDNIMKVLEVLSNLKIHNLLKEYVYSNNSVYDLLKSILGKSLKCYKILNNSNFASYCERLINKFGELSSLNIGKYYKIQSSMQLIKEKYVNDTINLPESFCDEEYNSFMTILKELEGNYPVYVSDIAHLAKSKLYDYFQKLNNMHNQVVNEYLNLCKVFVDETKYYKIQNVFFVEEVDLHEKIYECVDINEIPNSINHLMLKKYCIMDKLNYLDYINKYIGKEFVNNLEHYNKYIKSLKVALTEEEFARLNLDEYSDIIERFLDQTRDVLYNSSYTKVDDILNGRIIQIVITKALDQLNRRVYDFIKNKVEAQDILCRLNNECIDYNNYENLDGFLENLNTSSQISVMDEANLDLANIINKKLDRDQVNKILNTNGFSVNSSEALSKVIIEGNFSTNLPSLDLNIFKELNELMPDLATKIKCNLLYN